MFLRVTSYFVSFVVYELRHPRIDKCNRDIVKVAVLRVASAACWQARSPQSLYPAVHRGRLSCAEMPLDHLLPEQQQHRMHASTGDQNG